MRRHDLVTLALHAQPLSVACCTSDRATMHVRQWIAAARPFVCARQDQTDAGVRLGLAFIDQGSKHRAVVHVAPSAIAVITPPYPLEQCLAQFNRAEASVLAQLNATLRQHQLIVRVFGSVSWERASGIVYRTPASDLDLLCVVADAGEIRMVTQAFSVAQQQLPFRLDGELRFADGDGISWREAAAALANDDYEVLVKGERNVYLSRLSKRLECVDA